MRESDTEAGLPTPLPRYERERHIMYGEVTQHDLDNLKREMEYEIADLKQMVEDLRNDLRVEREARRSAVAELWEQTQTAK